MKTLIVYASKHGCTEKCAHLLAEKLPGTVDVVNMEKAKVPVLKEYDTVVIGGSIHVGRIQKSVAVFCKDNMRDLLEKKVGLFICCADETRVEAQMNGAFPEPLLRHAVVSEHFGHTYDFSKMNVFERLAIKVIAKTDQSVENYLLDNLERFAVLLYDESVLQK